jgi:hypothetical protein
MGREHIMDGSNSGFRPDSRKEFTRVAKPVPQKPALYKLARGAAVKLRQARTFVAGFLIGLSVWTPIFVATAAEETEWQQLGLPGGFAMLGAGVWLQVGRTLRRSRETQRQPRDPAGPSHSGMDGLPA